MAAARLKLSWMMLPISAPGHPGIVPALDVAEDGKKEADMNPNISADQSASNKKLNFRCADVGPKNCDWQISGDSEQEIMPKIESMAESSITSQLMTQQGARSVTRFNAERHRRRCAL